ARALRSSAFPSTRTRLGPEASQDARPKWIPGTAPTRASWRSSAVLMKCVWPRITFSASGFSIGTSSVSTVIADVSALANSSLVANPNGRLPALGRATAGEHRPRHMTWLRGWWTILGEVPDVEARYELAVG